MGQGVIPRTFSTTVSLNLTSHSTLSGSGTISLKQNPPPLQTSNIENGLQPYLSALSSGIDNVLWIVLIHKTHHLRYSACWIKSYCFGRLQQHCACLAHQHDQQKSWMLAKGPPFGAQARLPRQHQRLHAVRKAKTNTLFSSSLYQTR